MSAVVEIVERAFLAACFLCYMDALKLGDNYASPTSLAAYDMAYQHTSGSDLDRMTRRWGVENPAGLDPELIERDRRMLGLSDRGPPRATTARSIRR